MSNVLQGWVPDDALIRDEDRKHTRRLSADFRLALNSAASEREMQSYLESHPQLLSFHIDGDFKWVIPQKRFGSEHITDFMLGSKSSLGMHWIAVELESPRAKLFTRKGDPSAALTHAIRQMQDWRSWLADNLSYARRQPTRHGLGLLDIRARIPGIIVMGRRADLDDKNNELRYQLSEICES